MAYLAVNKNGSEIISEHELFRNGYYKKYCNAQSKENCRMCRLIGCIKEKETGKGYFNKVYRELPKIKNQLEELSFWDNFECDTEGNTIDYTVVLPKGSIKKLIGKELTWKDEPFEL